MSMSMRKDKWVVIRNGYFFRPGAKGYTIHLDEAGLFSTEEADAFDKASEATMVMPYLVAKYGWGRLRYDPRTEVIWNVDTGEFWPAELVSVAPHMVQHKSKPSAVPGQGTGRVQFVEPKLTADEVRAHREATGDSMWDAKKALRRAGYEEAMNRFRSDATIEDKVDFILDWITDKEMGR